MFAPPVKPNDFPCCSRLHGLHALNSPACTHKPQQPFFSSSFTYEQVGLSPSLRNLQDAPASSRYIALAWLQPTFPFPLALTNLAAGPLTRSCRPQYLLNEAPSHAVPSDWRLDVPEEKETFPHAQLITATSNANLLLPQASAAVPTSFPIRFSSLYSLQTSQKVKRQGFAPHAKGSFSKAIKRESNDHSGGWPIGS